jgi:macrolide-specific efflux system membrane fusion protein
VAHPHAAPRWPLARPRSLPSRPRLALILGAIVVVAGAAIGAIALTRPAPAATSRLVPVQRITLSQSLSATGTIEPATTSTLSFSAPGTVTAVSATAGEHVAAGQVLATMSSPTLQAQVAQANASLSQDQSQLSQDETSAASAAQLAADQAAVSADQAQVASADQALAGATLTAPAAGIVTSVGIATGPSAGGGGGGGGSGSDGGGGGSSDGGGGSDGGSDGGSGSGSGSGSITVVSAGDVVNASVDASVVDQIKAGDQVVITTEGASGPVPGTVASIGLVASTTSGVATFPVVIDVTGTPAGLYAGASANVSIIYHQVPDAIVVPAAALTRADGKTVVYTMTGGRKVARPVTTGITTGGLTQITSGLRPGQQVVVNIVRLSGGGSGGVKRFGGPGGGVFIGPRGGVIVPGGGGQVNIQGPAGG